MRKRHLQEHKKPFSDRRVRQYITEFEGILDKEGQSKNNEYKSLIAELEFTSNEDENLEAN